MDSTSVEESSAPVRTTTDMASAFAIKAALRKSMLRQLRRLTDQELETQSRAVFEVLKRSPFYQNARSVACYLSMKKGELRTDGIVQDLLSSDKKLYTPYLPPAASAPPPAAVIDGSRLASSSSTQNRPTVQEHAPGSENPLMEMLRLYSVADLEGCPSDKWGILDPGLERFDIKGKPRENVMDDTADNVDLILLPGVAFDSQCNRLGRGKAFYDRFLARYAHARPKPLLVALALSCQSLPLGETVPTTPNDFQLDGVVSPSGVVWRKGVRVSS